MGHVIGEKKRELLVLKKSLSKYKNISFSDLIEECVLFKMCFLIFLARIQSIVAHS